ncbi:MAG: hypothetical protein ACXVCQ_19195, partial [Bacteriovorax sp.]
MKKYLLIFILLFCGCQPSLNIQPRLNVYATSNFFADKSANRMPVPDTFTHRALKESNSLPKLDRSVLERGKNRFEIYCTVCHGLLG